MDKDGNALVERILKHPDLLVIGLGLYWMSKERDRGRIETVLNDPAKILLAIIGLLGFIYFTTSNDLINRISLNSASMGALEESTQQHALLIKELQTGQLRLAEKIEELGVEVKTTSDRFMSVDAAASLESRILARIEAFEQVTRSLIEDDKAARDLREDKLQKSLDSLQRSITKITD